MWTPPVAREDAEGRGGGGGARGGAAACGGAAVEGGERVRGKGDEGFIRVLLLL